MFLLAVLLAGVAPTVASSSVGTVGKQAVGATDVKEPILAPVLTKTISVGKTPLGIAYDSADTDVYVANNNSNTVSVISSSGATLNTVIATLKVGIAPQRVVYDPTSKQIYVSNYVSGTLSIIAGTSVLKTVKVCPEQGDLFYDPANGNMYVTNSSSYSPTTGFSPSTVYEVNSGTFKVTKIKLGVPIFPYFIFDPANGGLYAATFVYTSFPAPTTPYVIEISPTNAVTKLAQPLDTWPWVYTGAYSPQTKDVYISLFNATSTVKPSVIALTSTNTVAATIMGLSSLFAVYNPASTDMYFASYYPSNPDIVSRVVVLGTSNTVLKSIRVGVLPTTIMADTANGEVYVENLASNTTSVISSTNTLVATIKNPRMPIDAIFDPTDSYVFVLSEPEHPTTSASVQILSSATVPAVVKDVSVAKGYPGMILFDPTSLDVYVGGENSNSVSVISS